MAGLPQLFFRRQSQVGMREVQVSQRRFNDRQLCSPGLAPIHLQRDLVSGCDGPPRQDQISISSLGNFDVELIEAGRLKMLGKQLGLIVVLAAPNISIDFLQADDVWRLSFEDR